MAGSQEYHLDGRHLIHAKIFQKVGRVRYQTNRHEILHRMIPRYKYFLPFFEFRRICLLIQRGQS